MKKLVVVLMILCVTCSSVFAQAMAEQQTVMIKWVLCTPRNR